VAVESQSWEQVIGRFEADLLAIARPGLPASEPVVA
jgi:hypothetical protein